MQHRKLKNRLLELVQARERQLNRRIQQKEIAKATQIAEHTIAAWLQNKIVRFDGEVIERFCAYFECEVSDLLYLDLPQDPDQMDD
jgi:DNA-binding Xre family transcriptional regulator